MVHFLFEVVHVCSFCAYLTKPSQSKQHNMQSFHTLAPSPCCDTSNATVGGGGQNNPQITINVSYFERFDVSLSFCQKQHCILS